MPWFFFSKGGSQVDFFSLDSIPSKTQGFCRVFQSLAKLEDHYGSLNESELTKLSFEVSNLELAAWSIPFWDTLLMYLP